MSVQSEITRLEAAKAAISQAITEKGVTVPNGTMLDAMASLISAIEAGGGGSGGSSAEDSLVERTVAEYENDRVISIGRSAFSDCYMLTDINFPIVTSIGDYGFSYCESLTSANFPSAASIGQGSFSGCSALTDINFPIVTSIGDYGFEYCSSLTSANFPSVESIGENSFAYCSSLTSANFPSATSIGRSAFTNCRKLTTADFSQTVSIESGAFSTCTSLTVLILRSNSVCTLKNTSAFNYSPFAEPQFHTGAGDKTGTVYVPAALVESYKTAANWSTLFNAGNCTFVAIEGSEYE